MSKRVPRVMTITANSEDDSASVSALLRPLHSITCWEYYEKHGESLSLNCWITEAIARVPHINTYAVKEKYKGHKGGQQ